MSLFIVEKLLLSIRSNDLYIGFFAMANVVLLLLSYYFAHAISKRTSQWKANKNVSFSKFLNSSLNVTYSLFTTIITIFPLLGMLGTVNALLGLNISSENMLNVRGNFFNALTSTAWGIIFSILFKLVHALFVNYFENQIEDSRQMSDEINGVSTKLSR